MSVHPPVTVVAADAGAKPVLRRLLELYLHDFSEFTGQAVDEHGEFGYRYLDHYWTEADRHPFLFRVDRAWAGFALVRAGDPHDMAEFGILRAYRRHGIGRAAAELVLRRFPGPWQARQLPANVGAIHFWRRAIPVEFTESHGADGVVVQHFTIGRDGMGT